MEIKSVFLGMVLASVTAGSAMAETCADWKRNWYHHYMSDMHVMWRSNPNEYTCANEGPVSEALYHMQYDTYSPNSSNFAPDFYATVKSMIRGLAWDKDCKYLGYTHRSTGVITLCPPFDRQTAENRVSTIIHEARHLQSNDPSHVTCVGGPYDGKEGACDENFYNGSWNGSGYNIDIYYMAWAINNGKDLNGLEDSILRSEIRALVPDRFNRISETQTAAWRG